MEQTTDLFTDRYGAPKHAGQRMEKADFLRWESDDNYVYEYNDGILEPTLSMKQKEALVLQRLTRCFSQTDAYQQNDELISEIDVWVTEQQMRRPDVAYFSAQQLRQMASGANIIPSFVIEIVSENDDSRKYIRKLNEYFGAGVQAVWLIFPDDRTVYMYTSPKTVVIATDNDLLSAAPALPEFQLTAEELFQR